MARQVKVITAAEAAALIKNGDTVTTSGFVASATPRSSGQSCRRKIPGNRRTQRYYLCLLRFSG